MSSRRPALFSLIALLGLAGGARAASFPPDFRFRTLETRRVVVHYHQGLQPTARLAASMATEILEAHETRYKIHVGPKLHIVLADNQDSPNGFATPLPYPIVNIRAAAPDGSDDFGNYEGWLRFVLTHELAHAVHLEPAAGLSGFGRKVLGRAPFLFFNALTPTWMIEGLATHEETEGTSFGRGRNSDSRMVLRMAALEERFPHEDEAVLGLDRWPAGLQSYLAGEAYLRDLTSRSGKDTLPQLARDNVRHPIPYLDELTASHVTGGTLHTWWREWSFESKARFRDEAAQLEALGLTPSRALTDRGIRQSEPRFSPDGRRVAYTSRTNTRYTAIRVIGADGRGDRRITDRNGGSTLAWTPDGSSLVYDEPDYHKFFAVRSDLRRVDVATGRVHKLTRGVRARDPDVSREGSVVFVRRLADRGEL